jgi:hexosaminidase
MCEDLGKGRVYLRYLQKVHQLVEERGRSMMFWGDIIQNHTDIVAELPERVSAIDWGYEDDYDFDKSCQILKSCHIDFLTAPGTSLWNSPAGRFRNACINIDRAVEAVEKYGGAGFLLTDWGDNGHIPPPMLAWPLLAYGAARAWQGSESTVRDPLLWFLENYIKAETSQVDRLMEIYSNLSSLDESAESRILNGSILCTALFSFDTPSGKGLIDAFSVEKIEIYRKNIEKAEKQLSGILCGDDAPLKRFVESLKFSILFADYGLEALQKHKSGGDLKMFQLKTTFIIHEHKKLWNRNFRPGGLDFSISFLAKAAEYFKRRQETQHG